MSGTQAVRKDRKLVIVGESALRRGRLEYFARESHYEVKVFAVEQDFLKRDRLLGMPVVPFEELRDRFAPEDQGVRVAIVYTQLNRLRARLARAAKTAGYALARYISPHAFIWPNVVLGEHWFHFRQQRSAGLCVARAFVATGDNVVLWSGNSIGHHSKIGDNVFVSSHVVVSGFYEIGANSFLGVNVAVGNYVSIARDCWIGPGVVISQNTKEGEIHRSPGSEGAKVSARRFFRVKE